MSADDSYKPPSAQRRRSMDMAAYVADYLVHHARVQQQEGQARLDTEGGIYLVDVSIGRLNGHNLIASGSIMKGARTLRDLGLTERQGRVLRIPDLAALERRAEGLDP